MTRRRQVAIALALIAAMTVGCTASNAAGNPPPSAPDGGAVITASGLVFDRAQFEVPAGRAFPLLFENREFAPHNVAIYLDGVAEALFAGEIFSGPASRTYSVPALLPGTYRFRCDVHPDMSGTLIARS